jgi:hypothetical protein
LVHSTSQRAHGAIICRCQNHDHSHILSHSSRLPLPHIHRSPLIARPRVMVSLFNLVRRLFPPRKSSPECIFVPDGAPPQYVQVCGAAPLSEKASLPSCEDSSLLNPNLHFTASEIEGHLVQQDAVFAGAVVELMLPRLKLGVWKEPVGWGHYSYTVEKVSIQPHRLRTSV